ncbi:hypothetical protein UT300012_22320 [Paraclostridium bifermentans]
MKIYLNLNGSGVERLKGLERLTSDDKLSMVCEETSNFEFKVEEVRDIINSPCKISIIVTDKSANDTVEVLVETSRVTEETFVVDGKKFVSIEDIFQKVYSRV